MCTIIAIRWDGPFIIIYFFFLNAAYLLKLVHLLSDGLVLDLQVVILLLELLLLLQHHQPVLRRLDLLVRGLTQLPGEALDLGTHPLRPGLQQQHCVGVALLLHGHGSVPVTINQRTDAG